MEKNAEKAKIGEFCQELCHILDDNSNTGEYFKKILSLVTCSLCNLWQSAKFADPIQDDAG